MTLIGLTGGIASGKSLVADRFRELGAVVVDADVVAREVVEPGTPALAQLVGEFGPDILCADGSLNRQALGALVFSDRQKLEKLNAITHPAVAARTAELFESAFAQDPDAVVVYDVPLLLEARRHKNTAFDSIVVVQADPAERIRRMVENRGMTIGEAERRIAAQASDEDRRAIADVVIDNTGSIEATRAQVDEVWRQLHT